MMTIKLIKNHPNVQLAHLYEHLFCTHAKAHLYTLGLFKYVDFAIQGTTFDQAGLIEIDIDLYTEKAIAQFEALTRLTPPTDDMSIGIALNQLFAEEPYMLAITDPQKVRTALHELNAIPWENADELGVFDARAIRRKHLPIFETNKPQRKPKKVTTTLSVDAAFLSENPHLLPLFRHVATAMLLTTQDRLSSATAGYCGETTFRKAQMKAELLLHYQNHISFDEYSQIQLAAIKYMHEKGAFDRLCSWLQATSYKKSPATSPATYSSFNETHMYVGSKGWKTLATPEHIDALLRHTSVEVRFGRQKECSRLEAYI